MVMHEKKDIYFVLFRRVLSTYVIVITCYFKDKKINWGYFLNERKIYGIINK